MNREQVDPEELGKRLRLARRQAGMTQAEAAAEAGMARTTVLAIEQGKRPLRTGELFKFVHLYNVSGTALLRPEAVHVDLSPNFLAAGEDSDEAEATRKLVELVQTEADLENLFGIARARNYPPEKSILPGDVRAQAESDAEGLRQWLGIGQAPVKNIVDLLDFDLGVRVYVRGLDPKIRGLFAFDEAVGACMLLNAEHSREQRAETAGHELGRFVATRRKAEVLCAKGRKNSREERYADAFGRAFLMPADMVMRRFRDITAGAERPERLHAALLARIFGVTKKTMALRLEELGLIKAGGLSPAPKCDLTLADEIDPDARRPMPLRLSLLAAEAWRRDMVSEGYLANRMRLSRVSVREMVDSALIDDRPDESARSSG